MTWDAHINHISKKISKAIYMLYQLKHIYTQRILFTLYTTLIAPHLIYCLILWESYIKVKGRGFITVPHCQHGDLHPGLTIVRRCALRTWKRKTSGYNRHLGVPMVLSHCVWSVTHTLHRTVSSHKMVL